MEDKHGCSENGRKFYVSQILINVYLSENLLVDIQAKQGHFGTIGNRHFLFSQDCFKCGFVQKLHCPHLGAKHPSHFLHLFLFFPPT